MPIQLAPTKWELICLPSILTKSSKKDIWIQDWEKEHSILKFFKKKMK